mmetsp:Transcript_11959/g.34106  ORF Transcript_11959/g.34106 Transcript_11959/m.34106 type:complete len:266 (+) Transcript_11959:424-1221(+)
MSATSSQLSSTSGFLAACLMAMSMAGTPAAVGSFSKKSAVRALESHASAMAAAVITPVPSLSQTWNTSRSFASAAASCMACSDADIDNAATDLAAKRPPPLASTAPAVFAGGRAARAPAPCTWASADMRRAANFGVQSVVSALRTRNILGEDDCDLAFSGEAPPGAGPSPSAARLAASSSEPSLASPVSRPVSRPSAEVVPPSSSDRSAARPRTSSSTAASPPRPSSTFRPGRACSCSRSTSRRPGSSDIDWTDGLLASAAASDS